MKALDIETAPSPLFKEYENAALNQHRNVVTLIAIAGMDHRKILRSPSELHPYTGESFVTHNGKFDFKVLLTKGAPLTIDQYTHDTMLMGVALSHKIPDKWLERYNTKRREINKALKSSIHREAGQYSLKTMAPYFLGVEPFWEVADHDNEEYALKDAEYTLALAEELTRALKKEGTYTFYLEKLMPWARMLCEAEIRGVVIDQEYLAVEETSSLKAREEASKKLQTLWSNGFQAYVEKQIEELQEDYNQKKIKAVEKLVYPKIKDPVKAALRHAEAIARTSERYDSLCTKAMANVKDFNLSSPAQLSWLLKDYFGLDISTFKGDSESTGKAVLNRLAGNGREDVSTFLEYRAADKLVSAFFPSYREKQWKGAIHTNFNLNGARTGRLSSNGPNLQQVPAHLHRLFIPRPGMKFICYDLANIEPLLIAYFSEDKTLCEMMLEEKSFHDHNTSRVFGIEKVDKKLHKKERDACKEYGLSLLYGAYITRMAESFSKRGFSFSEKELKGFYRRFQEDFEGAFEYKDALDAQLEHGLLVTNIFGRPVVPGNSIKMQGFNTQVQGSASDLLIESSRRIYNECKEKGLEAYPLLWVHDEIVIEAKVEHAAEVDAITKKHLTGWKLPTKWGNIYTQCEGGISDYWKH